MEISPRSETRASEFVLLRRKRTMNRIDDRYINTMDRIDDRYVNTMNRIDDRYVNTMRQISARCWDDADVALDWRRTTQALCGPRTREV